MIKKAKGLSLSSRSLRYKLKISFYLTSILPLLVTAYLISSFILPRFGLRLDIVAFIAISLGIAIIGFLVVKEVFDRIVSVSTAAKMIAAGDIGRKLDVAHPDEVGDLGLSLNQLTRRIRSNMDELKNYSEKTTQINIEIQKRVIVLSSLLQVSSLISQGAKLEDILKLITEKARLLANSEMAYLLFREEGQEIFHMKAVDGMNAGYLLKIEVDPQDHLFNKAINANKPLIFDKQNLLSESLSSSFYEKFKIKNTLAMPIFLRGRVIALLGVGNSKDDFLYTKEDVELLDIFAKQVAIAVDNDILMHRVEKLEVKDALTGLYNQSFMHSRLQEEIKRSIMYQRPCAFILFDIDNFQEFQHNFGSLQTEATLKKLSFLIKDSASDVDRVGRFGDDEFVILLPEKNKRQAQEVAEGIRKKIEFSFKGEQDTKKKVTVCAGVSENPLDGINAEELIANAKELVRLAKEKGKNRVVGLKEPPACR